MNLLKSIAAPTPFWAKFSGITIAGTFAVVVTLQQSGAIDILPINPSLKAKIQGIVATVVALGGVVLAAQKKTEDPSTLDQLHM